MALHLGTRSEERPVSHVPSYRARLRGALPFLPYAYSVEITRK